jgi:hypothetical protein
VGDVPQQQCGLNDLDNPHAGNLTRIS